MPILLDTPHTYDPGAGAAPEVSAMVLVIEFGVDILEKRLLVRCQYGNVEGVSWISPS